MDSFDLVTVGKATLDVFLWTEDSNKHFRLNPATNEICIKLGDKAVVDKAYFLTGGNANNVAVGISRMGFKVAIVAEIGADEFAQKIINILKGEGVSDLYLKQTANQPSSFSIILNFQGDRTILEENIEREHDFDFNNIKTKWIYLTSMEKKWEEAYDKAIDFTKKNNLKLAFNPGTTQLDNNIEKINEILKICEIVFVNKEEAARICGFESANDDSLIPHLLSSLKERGVKIAVITDGAKGAHMIDASGKVYFSEPVNINVTEKTGAGDAFASGVLSGILSGVSTGEALKWGTINSASVIGNIGAQRGLLTKQNLEDKIKTAH